MARPTFILLVGALAFVVTIQVTLSAAFSGSNPQLAMRFASNNANALSRLATRLVKFDEGVPIAEHLARAAIRRDAIQPEALLVLGQTASNASKPQAKRAFALMRESERLSRRETASQLWLAEYFGKRGDERQALDHFDVILRTSLQMQASIFPLMISASDDPETEQLLLEMLARRPSWGPTFSTYAVMGGTDLDFGIEVARQEYDPRDLENRELYMTLMDRLAQAGRLEQAWALYRNPALGSAEASGRLLRDGNFEAASGNTPFDWTLVNEPELFAAKGPAAGDGTVLLLAASNGRKGVIASQFLRLLSGRYRLRARVGNVPEDRFDRPSITIGCSDSSTTLLALSPVTSGTTLPPLSGEFAVSPTCRFQRLNISIAGQAAQYDPLPWIDDLQLRRLP